MSEILMDKSGTLSCIVMIVILIAAVISIKPPRLGRRPPYKRPTVTGSYKDANGRTVWQISAVNIQEASSMFNGTTLQGDATRVITRVGPGQFEASAQPWDTEFK